MPHGVDTTTRDTPRTVSFRLTSASTVGAGQLDCLPVYLPVTVGRRTLCARVYVCVCACVCVFYYCVLVLTVFFPRRYVVSRSRIVFHIFPISVRHYQRPCWPPEARRGESRELRAILHPSANAVAAIIGASESFEC